MNIEFVSVNPTGPLHVGHARYASYGDALCRVLAFVGHDVTREFYVNDFGTQMLRFGQSLAARYGQRLGLDTPVPEEGYQGDYLLDLADELIAAVGDRYKAALEAAAGDVTALPAEVTGELKLWGREAILAQFRLTLERLRVPFDVWTPESSLYQGDGDHRGFGGEVGKSLADLDGENLLYDEEGAVWLTTTRYGDDKDRVLIRQTGDPTYFLSDIAYHRDKMDRGFEHLINIWGADHHGYVPRMKAAFTALPPHDPDKLELIIGQLVNLLESGEARRMSKRRGDIVTVDELIDAIGVDAARFLLVGRSHDTTLDLDIDLAVQQSNQNPVYYVQYAHARICSILRNLPGEGEAAGGRSRPGRGRGATRAVAAPRARALPRRAPERRGHTFSAPRARISRGARGRVPCVLSALPRAQRRCRRGGVPGRVVHSRPDHPRRGAGSARRQRAGFDVIRGRDGLASAGPQPPDLSRTQERSSSSCSAVRSVSRPSSIETAVPVWSPISLCTTLSSTVCATSRPGMAGV